MTTFAGLFETWSQKSLKTLKNKGFKKGKR